MTSMPERESDHRQVELSISQPPDPNQLRLFPVDPALEAQLRWLQVQTEAGCCGGSACNLE